MKAFNDDPELLEIPEWLAHLRDYISANLSDVDNGFEARLARALTAGGNLDAAHHRIQARIQREAVSKPTWLNERVARMHDRAANGDMPSDLEWIGEQKFVESEAMIDWRSQWSAENLAQLSGARCAERSAAEAAELAVRSAQQAAIAQIEQIVLDEVAK